MRGGIDRLTNDISQRTRGFLKDIRCRVRYCHVAMRHRVFEPTRESALIIAPHPDDETFACGGIIACKRSLGIPVVIIVLTSGENVFDRPSTWEVVSKIRQQQLISACNRLGVDSKSIYLLHLKDGIIDQLSGQELLEVVEFLSSVMKTHCPGEVFCPHPEDFHRDHVFAHRLTQMALKRSGIQANIFLYLIWGWYHGRRGLVKRLEDTKAVLVDFKSQAVAKALAVDIYTGPPYATEGVPYCGNLPRSLLDMFRRTRELFFHGSIDT
ncbi:PIG-L deacetylase family protein [Aestuariivirga sp.]|uniref:PIG-L deacetylase family protein n=1 Tax=Aestuariivirga sp. TaxID=2650926 RepID=UPI003BA9C8B2